MEYIPYLITPAFFLLLEIYGVIWRRKWDKNIAISISKCGSGAVQNGK